MCMHWMTCAMTSTGVFLSSIETMTYTVHACMTDQSNDQQ